MLFKKNLRPFSSSQRGWETSLHLEPLEHRLVLSHGPLITEFLASNKTTFPDGDGNYSDWIELYNPTGQTIDLTGWHLTDNANDLDKWTFTTRPAIPQDVLELAPREYLLVFASGQTVPDYIDASGFIHTDFKLGMEGEYLALIDPALNIVHEYAPEYPSQTTDISYGLDESGLCVYFTNPTPNEKNDDTSAFTLKVFISEIMYHPASNNDLEEYIEIYNAEAVAVDISNWRISGGADYSLPSMLLESGEELVIAADVAAFSAKYPGITNVVGGWLGTLSNRREPIALYDSFGRLVDRISYADEGNWAMREEGPLDYLHHGWIWSDAHDGLGSSLELVGFNMPNDWGQNWAASTTFNGTPGSLNSVADPDGDVAPLVVDIAHFPVIPSSADPVVVTAHVEDELATGVVATLHWRIDGTADFIQQAMVDDETGDDAIAGDHVFTATIPAHTDGSIVEFFVETRDIANNTRTYPAPTQPYGQQLTNLLYQVDDSFVGGPLPGLGDIPTYCLIMTNAERAELAQIGSNYTEGNSRALMNGTLVTITESGVDFRYNVGIRNRGESSRAKLPNSCHVDIASDNPWMGITAFNLNTQYTQLQLAGLRLFQEVGLAAEDASPVFVFVNGTNLSYADSPSFGVYVQIEAADRDFTANHYPEDDNGNLYRIRRDDSGAARGDLRDLGDDPEAYRPYYDKMTNVDEDDYSDLIHLVDVLNNTPDTDYFQAMRQVVDIDQWLKYFAVNAIFGNEETSLGMGVGDDYLMYRGVADPRFQLIPHDFDTILGQGAPAGSPTSSIYRAATIPAIARFLLHPDIITRYHNTLKELLETTFSKEPFDSFLDEILGDFIPSQRINAMKTFMDARRQYILSILSAPITAESQLPIVNGYYRTEQNLAALFGSAPLAETRSVVVNGQLADWDPVSGTWSFGETDTSGNTLYIAAGSIWQYLDAGQIADTTPGSDWRVDDPGWVKSGPAQLGYGDGDEATTVLFVDSNPREPGIQKNITTYFRRSFTVTNASTVTALDLRILRDDGAVVYLNGTEVVRSNMPEGATIQHYTLASTNVSGADANTFFEYSIDPSYLVDGENVLAVEIHQNSSSSADISFDLELRGTVGEPVVLAGLALDPGIHRILVQAYDGIDGTGNQIHAGMVDLWYDDGDAQPVSGTINTDMAWTAAAGPYVVTGDVTVQNGATLTIAPGTSVFFNDGTGLTVTNEGRILAEGTEFNRIRMTCNPASGATQWDGLTFVNTAQENRLTYIDMEAGDGQGAALSVHQATVLFEDASWSAIDHCVMDLAHPNIVVRNSSLPAISGGETVHLHDLGPSEQMRFDGNTIGFNSSGNDVFHLVQVSENPATIYFHGNTFLGGYDDGIDAHGFHVVIENNLLMHFHLNGGNFTTSNAIATGHGIAGDTIVPSSIELRNNRFYDNDHDLLLRDGSYAELIHNTMVGATVSTIQFTENTDPQAIGPGFGAVLDGNIIWDTALAFQDLESGAVLELDRSIVPLDLVGLGEGNLSEDPLLANPAVGNFSLLVHSPAIGTGPDGTDMGAVQTPHYPLANSANLRITELHYHPTDGNALIGEIAASSDLFEFVEFFNISNSTIDLSGVAFVDGIDSIFESGTFLEARSYGLVVKNRDVFESRYGSEYHFLGDSYSGQLSNGGETVRVLDATGSPIANFAYSDQGDWPQAPDGSGPSLTVIDTNGDYNKPANWKPSTNQGGSPGMGETEIPGDFDADLDVDGDDLDLWKIGFGTTTGAGLFHGDSDNDGDVDGNDFLNWQCHYNTNLPAELKAAGNASSSETVPGRPVSFGMTDLVADSMEKVTAAHKKQAQTYLKPTGCGLGSLLNFGHEVMKKGDNELVRRLGL